MYYVLCVIFYFYLFLQHTFLEKLTSTNAGDTTDLKYWFLVAYLLTPIFSQWHTLAR